MQTLFAKKVQRLVKKMATAAIFNAGEIKRASKVVPISANVPTTGKS
jgi:hypothetical protein